MADQIVYGFYIGAVSDHDSTFQNRLASSGSTILTIAWPYANEVQFSLAIAIVMPLKAVF
jgi:hypothetical protein